jgi:hypothetical protein
VPLVSTCASRICVEAPEAPARALPVLQLHWRAKYHPPARTTAMSSPDRTRKVREHAASLKQRERAVAAAAEDAGKPDEDEPMMGTGEGEMSILVVEEDDKTDGEVEGTGGDDEMSITGGGDEEGDKADEVGDSSDDGEMHILETNSTVVAPNGTKPCEDEMCIQGEPPSAFKMALAVGLS